MNRLEREVKEIHRLRQNVHEAYVHMLDLTMFGETILEWEEADTALYRVKRLKVDSILCEFKNFYSGERIDSLRHQKAEKEIQLFNIFQLFEKQVELGEELAERVPVIAYESTQEPPRKKVGFLGLFKKKEKTPPQSTTSTKLYTLNRDVIRKQSEQSRRLSETADSLAQRNLNINLKLKNIEGTEINGQGPKISKEKREELLQILDKLKEGDVLVLAGSIPSSLPDDIYKNIMKRLEKKNILIAVDATKDLLLNVLEHHPFLIKPNNQELGEIFGVELKTRESVIPYAKKLQEKGARNVLISMAGEGAALVAEDGSIYLAEAPKGTLVNGVGAGDSMVAGFLAGWLEKHDYRHAFHTGIAAGSASAFSEYLASREEVQAVYEQVTSKEYKEQ